MTPLLLTLDVGSTLRCVVLDDRGEVRARAVRPAPPVVDASPLGRRYQPDQLWRSACEAVREAVAAAGGPGGIAAVAATGQRIACAFLDGAGDAVYLGPNTDARGVAHGWRVDEAAGGALYERTGRSLSLLYAPARLLWLRDERPDEAARVRHVCGLGDWLAARLTGEVASDPCTAADLLVLDVHSGAPWPELWSALGLDPAWLPALRPAGARLGSVTAAAAAETGLRAGTPVAVTSPDSMVALPGAGAGAPGTTLVLAGSTMPVLASAERPTADATRRTWPGRHPVAGRGVCEANAGTTGFGWAWVAERLVGEVGQLSPAAAYRRAEELAAAAPAGAAGALLYAGGASVADAASMSSFLPRMRAAFWPSDIVDAGLSAAHLARAALEEVAHAAAANLERAEAARGTGPGPVVLAGGMARSPLFRSLVAGTCGRELLGPRQQDVTAVGAACCAAVAAELHLDLDSASAAMTAVEPVAAPDPVTGPALAEAHREWLTMYERIRSL